MIGYYFNNFNSGTTLHKLHDLLEYLTHPPELAGFKYMATNPTVFVREVGAELKKVKWPTREEVIRLTVAVLIISAFVGVFLGGVDLLLTKLMEIIL
jgi:preprotein translocase SecE subunit